MDAKLKHILYYLNEKHGLDFSGYRVSMLQRRIEQRISFANCKNAHEYFQYLQDEPDEFDHLVDVLTINVSRFFRNTLTFEYLANRLLSSIVSQKK